MFSTNQLYAHDLGNAILERTVQPSEDGTRMVQENWEEGVSGFSARDCDTRGAMQGSRFA